MKKALLSAIAFTLCLMILSGCAQERSCRVMCLKETGIVVWIEDLGYVYVKHVNSDLNIRTFDTVIMKFSENDLKPESGTFLDISGSELSYSYVLAAPNSIRLADSSNGEPTYG